jgi:hypothetical protein
MNDDENAQYPQTRRGRLYSCSGYAECSTVLIILLIKAIRVYSYILPTVCARYKVENVRHMATCQHDFCTFRLLWRTFVRVVFILQYCAAKTVGTHRRVNYHVPLG